MWKCPFEIVEHRYKKLEQPELPQNLRIVSGQGHEARHFCPFELSSKTLGVMGIGVKRRSGVRSLSLLPPIPSQVGGDGGQVESGAMKQQVDCSLRELSNPMHGRDKVVTLRVEDQNRLVSFGNSEQLPQHRGLQSSVYVVQAVRRQDSVK